MDELKTLRYERDGRIARITLNRPERGNAITLGMTRELERCVEWANLDPEVHVIALSGAGSGFCGGYDLVSFAEHKEQGDEPQAPAGSPLHPETIRANHDPDRTWDPMVDYAMMRRNVRAFMSLFHSDKPVVCKVHGFCVAGGTDMALCSDLLLVEDRVKIGYPPARVWGVPTTAMWVQRLGLQRAKRLLFTGDSLRGSEAVEWGLALEAAPLEWLDDRFNELLQRIAQVPVNQLMMHKLMLNQSALSPGHSSEQTLATVLDGIARHTPEGYAFQHQAMDQGFKEAVRARDEPFGDCGRDPE